MFFGMLCFVDVCMISLFSGTFFDNLGHILLGKNNRAPKYVWYIIDPWFNTSVDIFMFNIFVRMHAGNPITVPDLVLVSAEGSGEKDNSVARKKSNIGCDFVQKPNVYALI